MSDYIPPSREEFDKLKLDDQREANRNLLDSNLSLAISNTKRLAAWEPWRLMAGTKTVRERLIRNARLLQLERLNVIAHAERKAIDPDGTMSTKHPLN